MTETQMYPTLDREHSAKRASLTPPAEAAFRAFSAAVFADGALPVKMKQLIAVAAAHVTQCPYCIRGHTKAALKSGASHQEIMEAIWVAAEMRAGAAYATRPLRWMRWTGRTNGPARCREMWTAQEADGTADQTGRKT